MKKITAIVMTSLITMQMVGCSSVNTSEKNPYRLGDMISYKAQETSLDCLESTDKIEIKVDKYITFTPKENIKNTGFIFYPGGLVEPEAYAPMMKSIAEEGYKVIIVPMALNLAILSGDKAEKVIEENSDIEKWVIGGHSLGGVSACNYATKNDKIKGIVLYASYPQNDELKDTDIKVLSLWGSNDGVAKLDKVKGAKNNVNSNSEFIEIEGGNHGHFGDYGEQKGDGESTITSEEQWREAVQYTVDFLNEFN